jgi:hypothetical protein
VVLALESRAGEPHLTLLQGSCCWGIARGQHHINTNPRHRFCYLIFAEPVNSSLLHEPTTTSLLIANHNRQHSSRATRQPPRPVVCHSRALLLDANRPVSSDQSARLANILSGILLRNIRRRISSGPDQRTPGRAADTRSPHPEPQQTLR